MEALADLRRRGYRLGVITNWDSSARGILAAHGFDGCFEQVVVSCEVGCEKPDRRIFDLAAGAAGVRPAECLYVGDNYYVDAVGARGAGMESVIVNRFGRLGVEEIVDTPIVAHVGEVAGWLESDAAELSEPPQAVLEVRPGLLFQPVVEVRSEVDPRPVEEGAEHARPSGPPFGVGQEPVFPPHGRLVGVEPGGRRAEDSEVDVPDRSGITVRGDDIGEVRGGHDESSCPILEVRGEAEPAGRLAEE